MIDTPTNRYLQGCPTIGYLPYIRQYLPKYNP